MRLPFHVDLGRGAFAAGLSVLLYFVALNETNPESRNQTNFLVPVEVVNIPSGLVNTDRPPPVRLWVRAPLNVFTRLRADSFTAQVDATTAHAGDNDGLPITVRTTDPDVRAADPDPATVRLHLEELEERVLPVRVNLVGQVPSGYHLGQPRADPASLTVGGAATLVGRAVEAVVDVHVDRVTVSINGAFTPRMVDERGNDLRDLNLRPTPAAVNVSVPITQQTQYKELGIRPVVNGQPAPGYVLQPLEMNPSAATLAGDPAALESANFIETAPIDVTGIATTAVRNVALVPPAGTLLLQQGQTVSVTIRVTALVVTQTVRVPPSVVGLGPSVVLMRPPDPVAVTISGPAPTLSTLALNPSDFQITVDLSGRGAGRWNVTPSLQKLPTGLTLNDIEPKQVSVELREAPPTPVPTPIPGG